MDVETLREYCLTKKGVVECFPFGDDTLVLKVLDKIFALVSLEGDFTINLKSDPEKALELREMFPAVRPGYHMNKNHWNTVYIDGSVNDKFIYEWIDDSYNLVLAKVPNSKKKILILDKP